MQSVRVNELHAIFKRKTLTRGMEFAFLSFCHRSDDGSLKLKPVAWLPIEGVCVGCDCTVGKSEVYFSKFPETWEMLGCITYEVAIFWVLEFDGMDWRQPVCGVLSVGNVWPTAVYFSYRSRLRFVCLSGTAIATCSYRMFVQFYGLHVAWHIEWCYDVLWFEVRAGSLVWLRAGAKVQC
jgi:hypothetical protein